MTAVLPDQCSVEGIGCFEVESTEALCSQSERQIDRQVEIVQAFLGTVLGGAAGGQEQQDRGRGDLVGAAGRAAQGCHLLRHGAQGLVGRARGRPRLEQGKPSCPTRERECRGAVLKLAQSALAVVAIGMKMGKDELMQASARMRRLD